MKYAILYNEIKIGELEINAQGQHRYTPDELGVKNVRDVAPLTHQMLEKSDWMEPIPFFQNKIEDAKRFSQEEDICSHTDKFRMILM